MNTPSGGEEHTRLLDPSFTEAEIGRSIGPYKLLERLGEGGFGVVFVAEQREPIKRRVALKIIKAGMDTHEVVARFEAERQAVALMDHPNIAKVLDAGATDSGRPFFAMELVRGIPITSYCDQQRLSTRDRLELCIQVCHAVQHAHQKGIIHRDLKPSNILVTLHDGVPVPKVIDFGIAKAVQQELTSKTVYTQLHQFVGTPSYMSPEQAEMSGLDIDTRSDIYSLGVLLYEVLTGRPPFDGKELLKRGLEGMIRTIREEEPKRPSTQVDTFTEEERNTAAKRRGMEARSLVRQLRGDLDWVVMKCLEKDRIRRYETANAIASDLRRYLGNELVTARPASIGYRARKWARRNRVSAVTAGLVLVSLLGALVFSSVALIREKAAREREGQAERKRLSESVRAESVGQFLQDLVSSVGPTLTEKGDLSTLRELFSITGRLLPTALSNSPATHLGIQYRMAKAYDQLFEEPATSITNYARIKQLIPLVPEDRLPVPLDKLRIDIAAGMLDGQVENLHALELEFRNRKSPAIQWVALCLYREGSWLLMNGNAAEAKRKLAEASALHPPGISASRQLGIATEYGFALCDLEEWAEAIKVWEAGLRPWSELNEDLIDQQSVIIQLGLPTAYCALGRSADFLELLRRQEAAVTKSGGALSVLALENIRRARVAGLAQGGRPQEALALAVSLATNAFGGSRDCIYTAALAAGAKNVEIYRSFCGLLLARYTSNQEGYRAAQVVRVLLAYPQSPAVLWAIEELIPRIERSHDGSAVTVEGLRGFLKYRRGRFTEALEHFAKEPVSIGGMLSREARLEREFSQPGFIVAMASAQLGRVSEAEEAFLSGLRVLERTPSGAQRIGIGQKFLAWYLMDCQRTEAEQVFRDKQIAVPKL